MKSYTQEQCEYPVAESIKKYDVEEDQIYRLLSRYGSHRANTIVRIVDPNISPEGVITVCLVVNSDGYGDMRLFYWRLGKL